MEAKHIVESQRERIKAQRNSLHKANDGVMQGLPLHNVKKVLVINSSSRSGSSLLYAMLRKVPGIYSLTGEAAPFYKINTKFKPEIVCKSEKISDAQIDSLIDLEGLSNDFVSDCSLSNGNATVNKNTNIEEYSRDIISRLFLQWTDILFEVELVKKLILDCFNSIKRLKVTVSVEEFYLKLLKALIKEYPGINPYYYDIDTELVRFSFPEIPVPAAPPNRFLVIEEPPFVLQFPRTNPNAENLQNDTWLLKSTVDCYRMNLINRLFPNAEIKVIYLTRNPAATINGIFDGWLHRGFFSHNLEDYLKNSGLKKMNIRGYSDKAVWGKFWWNFDLPEGWENYINAPLTEICAFQWFSANSEIQKNIQQYKYPVLTVRYENFIRSLASRNAQFKRILDFSGIGNDLIEFLNLNNLPVVQATLPPQIYRWKKRKDIIEKLLDNNDISDMAASLGYYKQNMEEWL